MEELQGVGMYLLRLAIQMVQVTLRATVARHMLLGLISKGRSRCIYALRFGYDHCLFGHASLAQYHGNLPLLFDFRV